MSVERALAIARALAGPRTGGGGRRRCPTPPGACWPRTCARCATCPPPTSRRWTAGRCAPPTRRACCAPWARARPGIPPPGRRSGPARPWRSRPAPACPRAPTRSPAARWSSAEGTAVRVREAVAPGRDVRRAGRAIRGGRRAAGRGPPRGAARGRRPRRGGPRDGARAPRRAARRRARHRRRARAPRGAGRARRGARLQPPRGRGPARRRGGADRRRPRRSATTWTPPSRPSRAMLDGGGRPRA